MGGRRKKGWKDEEYQLKNDHRHICVRRARALDWNRKFIHQLAKVVTAAATVNPHNLITINTLLLSSFRACFLSATRFAMPCSSHLSYNVYNRYVNCIHCKSSISEGGGSTEKIWIKSWEGLLQSKSKRINRWKWRRKESSICEKAHVYVCVSPISTAFIGMNFNYGISHTAAEQAKTTMPKKCTKYSMDSDGNEERRTGFTVAKTKLEQKKIGWKLIAVDCLQTLAITFTTSDDNRSFGRAEREGLSKIKAECQIELNSLQKQLANGMSIRIPKEKHFFAWLISSGASERIEREKIKQNTNRDWLNTQITMKCIIDNINVE